MKVRMKMTEKMQTTKIEDIWSQPIREIPRAPTAPKDKSYWLGTLFVGIFLFLALMAGLRQMAEVEKEYADALHPGEQYNWLASLAQNKNLEYVDLAYYKNCHPSLLYVGATNCEKVKIRLWAD